jgi:hypothetical protein
MTDSATDDEIVSLVTSLYQKIVASEDASNYSHPIDFSTLAKMLTELSRWIFLFEICPHCGQLLLLCPRCNCAFANAEAFSGHYDDCDGAS